MIRSQRTANDWKRGRMAAEGEDIEAAAAAAAAVHVEKGVSACVTKRVLDLMIK